MSVLVFAYGSNLCIERLLVRTPSARAVATGTLAGYELRWHKRSRDGSGKCDAFETGRSEDAVWGAVYALAAADKRVLDEYEGLGEDYFERSVAVAARGGDTVRAVAYVANPVWHDADARPYLWYKGFVTVGARQHALPAEYRRRLEAIESLEDPDAARHERESRTLRSALAALRRPPPPT